MKAIDLLEWAINYDVDCSKITIIDVPSEQDEEWWDWNVGSRPPHSMRGGRYMYFDSLDGIPDVYDRRGAYVAPDFTTEIGLYEYNNFYLIEE